MPRSEDWAVIRMLVVLAILAAFSGPWTWELLLVTAALVWVLTAAAEILWGDYE